MWRLNQDYYIKTQTQNQFVLPLYTKASKWSKEIQKGARKYAFKITAFFLGISS